MPKIDDLEISCNLIDAALLELELLENIDKLKYLYDPNVINEALRRYETLWIPLMKGYDGNITAPMDIYWLWHVHMLSPSMYQTDMERYIGNILNHTFLSREHYNKALLNIKEIWTRRYPTESFEIQIKGERQHFMSQFSYDIASAACRQSGFFYQVSLPHYRKKEFLQESLIRYKMFLTLKKLNPTQFIVPCYDIDLIWHTHQLHPLIYASDCKRILGRILPHDDSVNDRSPNSMLRQGETETRNLWLQTFETSFSNNGSMYRRESSRGKLNDIDTSLIYTLYQDRVITFDLNFVSEQTTPFKYVSKVYLTTIKKHDHSICTYDYSSLNTRYKNNDRIFATEINDGFKIDLIKKTNFLISKTMFTGKLKLSQAFRQMDYRSVGRALSYKMDVTVKDQVFDKITLNIIPLSVGVSPPFCGNVTLGEFFCVSLDLSDPSISSSIPLTMTDEQFTEGIMASHSIPTNNTKQTFKINVIHVTKLKQSIVQVYLEDKLLTISHLIDSDQLPLLTKGETSAVYPTLDTKKGQCAMIIKDNNGDWAIIVGHWTGMKVGIPGEQGVAPVKGSPGHFVMKLFHLRSDKRSIALEIKGLDNIKFLIDDLFVNLTSGQITLRSLARFEQLPNYIGLAFAISVLYVLCKPRSVADPPPYPTDTIPNNGKLSLNSGIKIIGKPVVSEIKVPLKRGERRIDYVRCENANLCLATGYMYGFYIPCNSYNMHWVSPGGCDGIIDDTGGCGGCTGGGCGGGDGGACSGDGDLGGGNDCGDGGECDVVYDGGGGGDGGGCGGGGECGGGGGCGS